MQEPYGSRMRKAGIRRRARVGARLGCRWPALLEVAHMFVFPCSEECRRAARNTNAIPRFTFPPAMVMASAHLGAPIAKALHAQPDRSIEDVRRSSGLVGCPPGDLERSDGNRYRETLGLRLTALGHEYALRSWRAMNIVPRGEVRIGRAGDVRHGAK